MFEEQLPLSSVYFGMSRATRYTTSIMTQTTVAGMPSASFIAGLNVTLQLVAMCAEAPMASCFYLVLSRITRNENHRPSYSNAPRLFLETVESFRVSPAFLPRLYIYISVLFFRPKDGVFSRFDSIKNFHSMDGVM